MHSSLLRELQRLAKPWPTRRLDGLLKSNTSGSLKPVLILRTHGSADERAARMLRCHKFC